MSEKKKTDLEIRHDIIKAERVEAKKQRQYRLAEIRRKFSQVQKRETTRKEDVLESKVIPADDLFQEIYRKERLIEPTYSFSRLYEIYEQSDILQACVDTYQENIDGFGFQCQFLGDDTKGEKKSPEAKQQLQVMEDFFGYANHEQSWTSLRKEIREDLIVLGNGGIEVVRNKKGIIQMAFPVPFSYIRLARLPAKPRTVEVILKRGGKTIKLKIKKKFRRYAQIDEFSKTLRWFKEFGDDRPMDADTGKYTKVKNPATELWHIKTAYNGQAYGLPPWVSAVPQVIGRTNANYVNYDLFESQGIPPMAILVAGGTLTDESLDDLEAFLDSMRGASNWNRIMILETEVEGLGIDEKGHAKLDLKNLTDYRQDDQMFEKYLKATEKDVRKRLRLPPIYVGGTDVYTLATAKASQTIAEEQVFIPKRRDIDEMINIRLVQNELGVTLWKYKSKGPTIVGAQEISKGVETFGKAGAFTINHAIDRANEAFGLEMSKFTEPWADYPLAIVLELAKMGQLKGLEKLTGELEAPPKEPQQLPGQQQLMLPEMTEKMFRTKETGYSETERILYSVFTSIRKALEEVNKCDIETQL